MWWRDVAGLAALLPGRQDARDACAVHPGALIDESAGPVRIGRGTRICTGACLTGPLDIGEDCLVGNMAMVRGPARIGDRVRIGFASEIKQALIGDDVSIGPQCFIADSKIGDNAYLGAQVRTSNQRLDRQPVTVIEEGRRIATGMDKLGCWIGERAALGIQCIVLPGRVVAAGSLFEPRVTIDRNYPIGHYRSSATVESVVQKRNAA